MVIEKGLKSSKSFVLVVIGHDGVCKRVSCQIHIVFLRSDSLVVVANRQATLELHLRWLIVLYEAVVLDESVIALSLLNYM